MNDRVAPELPVMGFRPLGHFGEFRDDPLGLMLRARALGSDVVRVRIGPEVAHLLFHPDDIKRVLVDRHDAYHKQSRGYAALRMLLGDGLVTSEGSFWRRQRRIAQPAFHHKRLAGLAATMQRAAEALAARWEAQQGQEVDVARDMMSATLRIAGETLFSYDLSDESDEVGGAVTDLLHYFDLLFHTPLPFVQHLPTPTVLRGKRALARLDRVVYEIIAERRKGVGRRGPAPEQGAGREAGDLLDMFLSTTDADTGERMSDAQLRDEIVTMLVAGHETTANALTWTTYLLSKHPAVARQLEAELDAVLGGRTPRVEDLPSLRYAGQVLEESMRLYPPVWALARIAGADDTLSGYHVPAGGLVVFSSYVVHRDPRFWPNPEGFDPDRFSEDGAAGRPKHAYFPFSLGPRKCIGDHFARMEALILMGTLLGRFRVAVRPGHQPALEPSVTLRPRGGMPMTIEARTPAVALAAE